MFGSSGIIPNPSKVVESGDAVRLDKECGITYGSTMQRAGNFLSSFLGIDRTENGFISIVENNAIIDPEGYYLDIGKNGIRIEASGQAGSFYAAQSLRQLLPLQVETEGLSEPVEIACMKVQDSPRFYYRGFMLDCARHFFDVETIKKIIDLMALHKMNRFHWHLTDDQGFRIEIDKYPLLSKIGSGRNRSQISGHFIWGGKKYDNKPHGGFYSKSDIREIVEYAGVNCIEVIPELDVPGHSTALLAAYPQYSCSGNQPEVGESWGIYNNLVCAGKKAGYNFLFDILDEIISIFPCRQIHLGADETPLHSWKRCPDCLEMIKGKGLGGTKELKTFFLNRIIGHLKGAGVGAILWDDASSPALDAGATLQYWSPFGRARAHRSLSEGRKMIVSPFYRYYLDYTYKMIPLRKTYEYDPLSIAGSDADKNLIIGVEAPLWTEYVSSKDRLFWQMFPRLSAVSETAWSESRSSSYENFLSRFRNISGRLHSAGATHASLECYGYDGMPSRAGLLFSRKHISDIEYERFSGNKIASGI